MAQLKRVNPGTWSVSQPQRIVSKDGKITDAVAQQLYSDQLSLSKKLNGLISLGNSDNGTWAGNLDAQHITFLTPGANTEFVVSHGLDRIPRGYFAVRKDRAADLYDSRSDAWTVNTIYLKCSVASATIGIILY